MRGKRTGNYHMVAYSPSHQTEELYWKPEKPAIEAMVFWEDTMQYLYLPRLKNRDVFAQGYREWC